MLKRFYSFKVKIIASACVFLTVSLIGCSMPLAPPSTFTASARVWIQQKQSAAEDQRSNNLFHSFMSYFNSPIMTACQVMASSVVLEEAVKELKGQLPADKIPSTAAMQGAFRVSPVEGTDIVSLSYTDQEGPTATSCLQAIINAFLKLQNERASYTSQQSKSFFAAQLVEAKDELKQINAQIKSFQSNSGILGLEQVSEVARHHAAAQESLQEAESRLRAATERADEIQKRLGTSAEAAIETADTFTDPAGMEYRKRFAALQSQYSELSSAYKPGHPRMRQLLDEMEQMKKNAAANGFILDGQVGGGNTHAKQELAKALVTARAEQSAERSRVESYQRMLAEGGDYKELPQKQAALVDLLRTQKVVQERVAELELSMSSAKLMESLNAHSDNFQIIDKPQIAGVSVVSKRPKIISILLLALALGALTFFVLDRLDPRLRSINSLLNILPLPVIGWVPELGPLSAESLEPIHRLRLGLKSWLLDGGKEIVVTSAEPQDGKSFVATGLAMSFAQSGMRVLLVDANSKRPRLLSTYAELPAGPGLSEFLTSSEPDIVWSQVITPVAKNLKLITAGGRGSGNSLLSSEHVLQLMERARREADVVIYNTPSVSESSAALALLLPETFLIVVARMKHTHVPNLRLMATQLKRHQCATSAIVLTDVEDHFVASALSKAERADEPELVSV